MYSFPDLDPVCCSMSSSNCCFLTCIQISQEAGQVVWYSHLFQSFPQFLVIHTVKGFGIVNKAEVDIFLELSLFWWSSGDWQFDLWFLCFLNPAWTSGSSQFTYCWSLAWRIKCALIFLNTILVEKGDKKKQMYKNMGNLLKICPFPEYPSTPLSCNTKFVQLRFSSKFRCNLESNMAGDLLVPTWECSFYRY